MTSSVRVASSARRIRTGSAHKERDELVAVGAGVPNRSGEDAGAAVFQRFKSDLVGSRPPEKVIVVGRHDDEGVGPVPAQHAPSSRKALTVSTASMNSLCSSIMRPSWLACMAQSTAPPSIMRKNPAGLSSSTLRATRAVVGSVGMPGVLGSEPGGRTFGSPLERRSCSARWARQEERPAACRGSARGGRWRTRSRCRGASSRRGGCRRRACPMSGARQRTGTARLGIGRAGRTSFSSNSGWPAPMITSQMPALSISVENRDVGVAGDMVGPGRGGDGGVGDRHGGHDADARPGFSWRAEPAWSAACRCRRR